MSFYAWPHGKMQNVTGVYMPGGGKVTETFTDILIDLPEGFLVIKKELSEEDIREMKENERLYREECEAQEDWIDE